MHVDVGIATSVFSMPLSAGIPLTAMPAPQGPYLCIVVNEQLARTVRTTR